MLTNLRVGRPIKCCSRPEIQPQSIPILPKNLPSLKLRLTQSENDIKAVAWLRTYYFPSNNTDQNYKPTPQHRQTLFEEESRQLNNQLAPRRSTKKIFAGEGFNSILAECEEREIKESGFLEQQQLQQQLEGIDVEKLGLENGKIVVGTLDIFLARLFQGQTFIGNCNSMGYIANVCVASFVRKQGVGSILVNEARDKCEGFGAQALFVHVSNSNRQALNFYERNSFQRLNVEEEQRVAPLFSDTLHGEILFRDSLLWQ